MAEMVSLLNDIAAYAALLWLGAFAVLGLITPVAEYIGKLFHPLSRRIADMAIAGRITLTTSLALIFVFCAGFNAWRAEKAAKEDLQDRLVPSNDPFLMARENTDIVKQLGSPTSDILYASYAYMSSHQNAILLWIQPLNKIIRLNRDQQHSFSIQNDENPGEVDQFTETTLQRALDFSDRCLPPLGGFANLALKNPGDWKNIGCRVWHCGIKHLRYQIFTNGLVINGVPQYSKSNIIQVIYLIDRQTSYKTAGKWIDRGVSRLISSCIPAD